MQILLTEHGINATVEINRRFDVPFLAGASNDGKTVYIDRRVPRKLAIKRKGGRGYVSISPDQFLATHETVEHRLMVHQKMPYLKAHAIATHAEKAAVEGAGADWDNYEKVMDGLLAHIEHEKPRRAPPNLYLKPYPHDKKVLLKKLAVRSRAEGGPLEADPNAPDQDNPWESVPRDASGRPVIYIGGAPDPKQTAPGSSPIPGQVENPQFAQPPSLPGPGGPQNIQPDQSVPPPRPPSPVNGQGQPIQPPPSSDAGAANAGAPSPAPPVPGPHKPTPDEIYAWEHGEAAPAPPQPPAEHTRSILDKLLGLGGPRYQLFPERIVRSALTAPGEVLATGQLTQRDPYGRVTGVEPEISAGPTSTDILPEQYGIPGTNITWSGSSPNVTPAGFPSDTAIQRAQDIAAMQFSGGTEAAAEEAAVAAKPAVPALPVPEEKPAIVETKTLSEAKAPPSSKEIVSKEEKSNPSPIPPNRQPVPEETAEGEMEADEDWDPYHQEPDYRPPGNTPFSVTPQIKEVFDHILQNGHLEDRMEYGLGDLMHSYQLPEKEASSLYQLIHNSDLEPVVESFAGPVAKPSVSPLRIGPRTAILGGAAAAVMRNPSVTRRGVFGLKTEAGKPGAAIAAAERTPFYSAVEQAIPKAPQNKMTADQWTGWLKNQPGVKAEELEWSGLGDLPKGPITKDQLLTHLKENQVQPQLVEKSGEPPMSEDEQVEAVRNKMEEEFARQYPFSTADDFRDYMDTDEGYEKYHELLAELPEQMERQPKYSEYQLPGGTNYREQLLTLPLGKQVDPATIHEQLAQLEMEFQKLDPNDPMSIPHRQELRRQTRALEDQLNGPQTAFQSSHWDEPNVLLHLRMNDRVIDAEPIANIEAKVQAAMPNAKYAASGTPDQLVKRGVLTPQEAADWSRVHNFQSGYENQPGTGLKTLHLEELQSDWHQKGRKQGYDDPIAREAAEKKLEAAGYPISNEDAQAAFREGIINREDVDAIRRNYIPNAPFKTTWPDLGLKTAITKAAREGYDSISWTPGEKQAERYDLSKHVDAIRYAKNPADGTYTLAAEKGDQFHPIGNDIPESKLEDYLGKDVAERVIKGMGDETNGVKLLSGLDLKVGGEGMKGFYDKMLVDKANALGKKFGAKVEYKNVPIGLNPDNYILSRHGTGWVLVEKSTGDRMNPIFSSGGQAEEWLKKQNNSIKVPVLRLTPQLKEQALKGMPLFTEAGKPGAALAAAEHSLDPNAIDRQLARNPGASIFDVGGRPDLNPPVAAPTVMKGAGSPLGIRSPQLRQLFDRTIGPYMPEQEFANKYLMGMADPESTVIEPSDHFDGAGIAVTSSLVDPKTNTHLGSIERHIVPGEAAYHAALEINPKAPSGFTKQLLQNQIDLYNKMGVRYVDLYANISVGGYAWAKYGWVPEANAWDSIRSARPGTILGRLHRIGKVVEENPEVGKQIPPQVLRAIPKIAANPDPRSIWDIADINTPIPRELVPGSPRGDMYATYTHPSTKTIGQYLLKGMGWDGRLNLFDPESMERFNGYIGRGGAGQTLKSEAGKPAMALAASKGPWKTEGNNVLAYHGTTAEGAAGIEQEGLKVNAGNRRYPGHSLYRGDRGHSVFLSPDPLEAAEWGPHVYEARIPKDDKLFKHNPDDPFDTEGRYRGDIPRNWLKKWEKP